jgi:hypothetical protein
LDQLVRTLRELVGEGKTPIRIQLGSKRLTVPHDVEDELRDFAAQEDILRDLGIKELA